LAGFSALAGAALAGAAFFSPSAAAPASAVASAPSSAAFGFFYNLDHLDGKFWLQLRPVR